MSSEIKTILDIVDDLGVDVIGDFSFMGDLTPATPLSNEQREINHHGLSLCRQALELRDYFSRCFKKLSRAHRRIIFGSSGIKQMDLISPMSQGYELEDFSVEGKLKIIEGMMTLHDLVDALPSRSTLNELKKKLEKRQ